MILYHCHFSKENSYRLLSNWAYNKFVDFNFEMFIDDRLPIHYSKTPGHVTVEFYFNKEQCFGFKHYY